MAALPGPEWDCVAGWREGLKAMPGRCQAELDRCYEDSIDLAQAAAASERAHWKANSVRRWVLWLALPLVAVGSAATGYLIGQAAP